MTEMDSTAGIRQRMTALRRAFVERIPVELQVIRDLRDHLHHTDWAEAKLAQATKAVNSFTGAATSFGFDDLGEAARVLGLALRDVVPDQLRRDREQRARLEAQFEALFNQPLPDARHLDPIEMPSAEGHVIARDGEQAKRIFVLDDNLLVCRQLADQIGLFGYSVECFADFAAFSEAFRAKPCDAVIVDFDFSDRDGSGTTRIDGLLHGTAVPPPMLVMSSHDDIGSRLRAVRAGGCRFLVKPLVVPELIDAIDELLDDAVTMPTRVLIVDDSEAIGGLYAGILEGAGMKVRAISDPLAALDVIAEFQPDLALVDLYMPECSGEELAAVIRQNEAHVNLPIVFLSSETDRDRQLSALRLGADEFLTKPIDPAHLVTSVSLRAERARQLAALVQRDSLTSLLNHGNFVEAAVTEIKRARRLGLPCTLALLDIDHFKTINDVHGHPAGDRVLKNIARRLRHRLRAADLVGRFAGEEFCVMFSGTDGPTAQRVIDTLREDLSRLAYSSAKGIFHVHFSAGLAAYPDYDSVEQMIDAADRSLAAAKHSGRNCSVLAGALTATPGQ